MNNEFKEIERKLQSVPHSHIKHRSLSWGMELYFFETNTDAISMQHPKLAHIMEINYCRSGRIGWNMGNQNQIYLGPGDFSIHTLDACANSDICFPDGAYEGLALCIDLDGWNLHLPKLLAGAGIGRELFEEKFLKNSTFASFAGNTETDAIFSAFYGQPECLALAYQKLKSLELLLYLSKMEPEQHAPLTEYQSEQVAIVRQIHQQLTEHIEQRVTIESLSQQYLINPTTLKAVFKSVYGSPIAAHIKEHRMELAAKMLRESNQSIAEIAQAVGYDSQSKFATVFKAFYQMLPSEYRKMQLPLASAETASSLPCTKGV